MVNGIVWRKTVYDTNKCPQCGMVLIGDDNEPINLLEDERTGEFIYFGKKIKNWLYCRGCQTPVAFITEYEGEITGKWERKGRWDED